MTRNDVTDIGCDEKLFKRVVKTVFNQRRKNVACEPTSDLQYW